MATAVTVLIGILSAGLLAGRIYELLRLIDPATGFFIYKGIVFNPVVLALFAVIVICCGVLVFGDEKTQSSFFSKSSRPIAVAAGVMFLAFAVSGFMAGGVPVVSAAAAVAMLTIGIAGLSVAVSVKNILAILSAMVFFIGSCLEVIVGNVCTIHNIEFTKNALCTVAAGLLLVAVMKNIWSPSKYSKMLIYIAGVLAFAMCGIMHIADIVNIAATASVQPQQLLLHAGYAFVGIYGLDNAVSALPKKQTAQPQPQPAAEQVDVENVQDTIKAQLTAIVDSQQPQPPVQEEEVTAYVSVPHSTEKSAEYTKFFAEMYGTENVAQQPPQKQLNPAPQPHQPVSLNIKHLTGEIPLQIQPQQAAQQPAQDPVSAPKTTWKADGKKTVYKKPKN